jgi:hypothetical protein
MALGGYQGWDRILTTSKLQGLVGTDTVRFFLLSEGSGRPGPGLGQDATADLTAWVRTNCTVVPAERWQSDGSGAEEPVQIGRPGGGFGQQAQQLLDCSSVPSQRLMSPHCRPRTDEPCVPTDR